MKKAGKIQLTEEKETLLITLLAKARDNRSRHSILHDKTADEILKSIDYDFSKLNGFGDKPIVLRAKHYDEWLSEFLTANSNAIVLNLGCGLDTRVTRINPAPAVSWFDLDYPDVINLRKNFYKDRPGYKMIESSVTEAAWIEQIPNDQPAVIIAEGIFEYLVAEDVKVVLARITEHFQRGEIMFDVMSPQAIKSGSKKLKKSTGAVHKWAVDDPAEVDSLNADLERIKDFSPFESPWIKNLSFPMRLFYRLIARSPKSRNMLRMLCYRFNRQSKT